jgi:hypothetical protein
MRIGADLPPIHTQNPEFSRNKGAAAQGEDPGVVVDISQAGREAYGKSKTQGSRSVADLAAGQECQTCKSRKYVDVSDDPSVSFQSPTHISPGQSAAAVSSHEGEHVANEQAKAERDGREIVSQSVTLKTSICPECKRVYVSGGVTYTLSMQKPQAENSVDLLI